MKKFFTMIGAALMLGCFAAQANPETFDVRITDESADGGFAYQMPFESFVSKNADGSINLGTFFNTDYPITFSFDPIEVGETTGVRLVGNLTRSRGESNNFYIATPKGTFRRCYNYTDEDEPVKTTIAYPYVYNDAGYSYVKRTEGDTYFVLFSIQGQLPDKDENGKIVYTPWYYVSGYFDMNEIPETSTVAVDTYDWDEADYVEGAKPFESLISLNEDGSYTMSNFFNSYYPLSFKFETPAEGEDADIVFTDYVDNQDGYIYVMEPDGKTEMTGYVYPLDGSDRLPLTYVNVVEESYSYVTRLSAEDAEYYGYEYYGSICTYGYLTDAWSDYYYLSFYFNPIESTNSVKGIENIENANAPVEFYNLNGMKVADPANGIFIRKQGNKVSKVVVK